MIFLIGGAYDHPNVPYGGRDHQMAEIFFGYNHPCAVVEGNNNQKEI
jgi:hypothetical protein